MNKLLITSENEKIGELTFNAYEDKFLLKYDESWKKKRYALSPHLPLDSEVNSVSLRRYLENQFPEGRGLEILLEELRIGRGNIFRIIQVIGQETTGALRFNDPGASDIETNFRELGADELVERLNNRNKTGLVIWDGKPRLSVAGVQDKLPITILSDGRMGFGEGELASTHIMKFQTSNEKIPSLVLNEYFCMKLAKAIGLKVADVEYKKIGPHPILFVKRFDRILENDSKVIRKHIIDGCQALDLPSSYKYEKNFGSNRDVAHIRDGANFKKVFEFCFKCQTPAMAILQTLKWMIFNLCISNADSHGKNLSYFIDQKGINPAPAYDLVNISIYPNLEQDLAMSIGDEFKGGEVKAFQLHEFCEENKIQPRIFVNQFKSIAKGISQKLALVDVGQLNINKEEIEFVDQLRINIQTRTDSLLKCVNEVLRF